jgi:hypothetical protein
MVLGGAGAGVVLRCAVLWLFPHDGMVLVGHVECLWN